MHCIVHDGHAFEGTSLAEALEYEMREDGAKAIISKLINDFKGWRIYQRYT